MKLTGNYEKLKGDKMRNYLTSAKTSLFVMLFCTFIFILNAILPINFNQWGIVPRNVAHLSGVLFAPFLHGSWQHLISNFIPFVVLGSLIGFKSTQRFWVLFILQITLTGLFVWLFARGNTTHIGMSGVIYALWGYLIVYGILRRQLLPFLASLLTLIIYGGIIFGVFPSQAGISFESHLFGAISGGLSGYYFARFDRKSK